MKESAFQTNVVRGLRNAGFYVFAVPNGGSRNLREAVHLKAQGVLAGVADLVICLPKGKVHFVELKNLSGKGRQSPAQRQFQADMEYYGNQYHLWDSWNDVEEFIRAHRKEAQNREDDLKVGGTD